MVILKRSMVVDDIRWVAKVKTLRETASWRGSESALNLKRKRLGRDLIWVTVPIVVRTMFKKRGIVPLRSLKNIKE
jgi:hypothetical protein